MLESQNKQKKKSDSLSIRVYIHSRDQVPVGFPQQLIFRCRSGGGGGGGHVCVF